MCRLLACFLVFSIAFPLALLAGEEKGEESLCKDTNSRALLAEGMKLQEELETQAALARYRQCLEIEPSCSGCLYEIGWSYWRMGEWDKVVDSWENLLTVYPAHQQALQFIDTARENEKIVAGGGRVHSFKSKLAIGEESRPAGSAV